MGGSTATGALGYVAAFEEIMDQCAVAGFQPHAIVVTSSSGGTHAGLVAGRARRLAEGHLVPDIVAIGVAKGVVLGLPSIGDLAGDALAAARRRRPGARRSATTTSRCDGRWMGDDYTVPTAAGDDAAAMGCSPRWLGARPHVHRPRGSAGCSASPPRAAGRPAPTSCSSTPAACRPVRARRCAALRPSAATVLSPP